METELQEPYLLDGEGEPTAFTVFMDGYPKKENRHAALREWKKISPDLRLEATIMRALRILRQTDKWRNGYMPSAFSFLRDRRWMDADGLPDPQEQKVRIEEPGPPKDFKPSTPESAKAALREGFLNRWKMDHPGQEPPSDLLKNPLAVIGRQPIPQPDSKIVTTAKPTERAVMCSTCNGWIVPPEQSGDPAACMFLDVAVGMYYHCPKCLPEQFEWDADNGIVRLRSGYDRPAVPANAPPKDEIRTLL